MVAVMREDPAVAVAERPGTNYAYVAINFNDPVLAHREVRQALAYATDRESISPKGGGTTARSNPSSPRRPAISLARAPGSSSSRPAARSCFSPNDRALAARSRCRASRWGSFTSASPRRGSGPGP